MKRTKGMARMFTKLSPKMLGAHVTGQGRMMLV